MKKMIDIGKKQFYIKPIELLGNEEDDYEHTGICKEHGYEQKDGNDDVLLYV